MKSTVYARPVASGRLSPATSSQNHTTLREQFKCHVLAEPSNPWIALPDRRSVGNF